MVNNDRKREMLRLLREEVAEHLQAASGALMEAEREPAAADKRYEIALRALHSVKGGLTMVGLKRLAHLAHSIESCAQALAKGHLASAPEIFDVLYRNLDALQENLDSVAGLRATPDISIDAVFGTLTAAFAGHCELHPLPEELSISAPTPAPEAGAGGSSVRVTVDKLDRQMADVEELLQLTAGGDEQLGTLRRLAGGLEQWHTSLAELRRSLRQKDRESTTARESARLLALVEEQWQLADTSCKNAKNLYASLRRSFRTLGTLSERLQDNARAVRMLPVSSVVGTFERMVRDLAREQGKEISLLTTGTETEVDRNLLEAVKDPLMHLLRNSVAHGVETPAEREQVGKSPCGVIRLEVRSQGGTVEIEVGDDGRGIAVESIRAAALAQGLVPSDELQKMDDQAVRMLVFRHGFSTAARVDAVSGRGVGLDVVRQAVEALGGRIVLHTVEGNGTVFGLTMPLSLTTMRMLLVEVGGDLFALPVACVERVTRVRAESVRYLDAGPAIELDGRPLALFQLAEVLHLNTSPVAGGARPGLVLAALDGRAAFLVDKIRSEQELVVKGLGDHLQEVPSVSGATVLSDGRIVPILNPADLLRNAMGLSASRNLFEKDESEQIVQRRILVVDDSVTTRTLLRSILEAAGYLVEVAMDGVQATEKVKQQPYDLILSDVQMPRMNGLDLVKALKSSEPTRQIPVVLVSSLDNEEHRKAGLNAGADAYLGKNQFEQKVLLGTLERLL